ncbi:MAG: hypothetical protein M3Z64_04665 [Verrucomicrobiota bacterium]|nr:hypothetical protein [Verrucomicrobiota bacterium]
MEYTDNPKPPAASNEPQATATASKPEMAEGQASDAVAVLLSVVPGLGHVYKGYKLIGFLLIFVGTPIAVALALLAATGTAGFALLLLPIYWIAVMFHVYGIEDRAAAKATASIDQGEEY